MRRKKITPEICPKCGSEDTTIIDWLYDPDREFPKEDWHCLSCGIDYTVFYKPDRVEIDEGGD